MKHTRILLAAIFSLLAAAAQAACFQGPPGQQNIAASSGNVAASTATATLTSVQNAQTTLTKVIITGTGATGATVSTLTITGLIGGTQTYIIGVPAGATLPIVPNPTVIDFSACPQTGATGASIVGSMTTFGAGNTNATLTLLGY